MILITGVNGFIGSHLAQYLNKKGFSIIGVDIISPDIFKEGKFYKLNLLDPHALNQLWEEDIKVIIHSAAILPSETDNQKNSIMNVQMDQNVFNYCHNEKIKLIYISGATIHDLTKQNTVNELSPFISSGSPYLLAKKESELYLDSLKLNYVSLRLNAPYGSNQKAKTVINIFIQNSLMGLPLLIYNEGERLQDFTFISDICRAVEKSLHYGIQGCFLISSGNPISMYDLAKKIIKISKSSSKIISQSFVEDSNYPFFDISKAERILKWSPKVKLNEGIKIILNQNENWSNF